MSVWDGIVAMDAEALENRIADMSGRAVEDWAGHFELAYNLLREVLSAGRWAYQIVIYPGVTDTQFAIEQLGLDDFGNLEPRRMAEHTVPHAQAALALTRLAALAIWKASQGPDSL